MSAPSVGSRTVGGKYTSTGNKAQMAENLTLVTRLIGEIGVDGYPFVLDRDKPFIDDTRFKLRGASSQTKVFGFKQVEALVGIHAYVVKAREEAQSASITTNR